MFISLKLELFFIRLWSATVSDVSKEPGSVRAYQQIGVTLGAQGGSGFVGSGAIERFDDPG